MTTQNKIKLLSCDLPIDSICPFIGTYEDAAINNLELFPSYDFLDMSLFSNPEHVACIIINNLIKEYLSNFKITLESLQSSASIAFFSLFDPSIENNKNIATNMYCRIVEVFNCLDSLVRQYKHIAPALDYYTTIGIRPRNSYKSYIDALFVGASGADLFLVLRKESGADNHVAFNLKLLSAIDYCNEASIKINKIHYIAYNWNLCNSPSKIILKTINMTDYIQNTVYKYSNFILPHSANLGYCGKCAHKLSCVKNNYYGKSIR